jgi:MOSC domain-containing protein YiiM
MDPEGHEADDAPVYPINACLTNPTYPNSFAACCTTGRTTSDPTLSRMPIVLRTLLVGLPQELHDDGGDGTPWRSGFAKQPRLGPTYLSPDQLTGDGQADRTVHGGPEKALLGYCADHYAHWQAELARPDLIDGAFGENLALTGLDEEEAAIGDRFACGKALIEISQPRQPCWKLARRCRLPTMPAKAIASGRLGWYFRVITPGLIQAGDTLIRASRSHPDWTIARINRLFFGPAAAAQTLLDEAAHLPAMSPEFVAICRKRFVSA